MNLFILFAGCSPYVVEELERFGAAVEPLQTTPQAAAPGALEQSDVVVFSTERPFADCLKLK